MNRKVTVVGGAGNVGATVARGVADKQLADAGTLAAYAEAWGRAAERTPHGTPIELAPGDFA